MPSSLRLSPSVLLLLAAALPGAEPALSSTPGPAAAAAPAAGEAGPWIPDPADRTEIARLLSVAVAHGFPDTAGAVAFAGELVIPGADMRGESGYLMTGRDAQTGREVKRGIIEEGGALHVFGFHLKLADGRWLAGLTRLLPATAVDVTRLAPLSVADFARGLREPASGQPALSADEIAWCEGLPPDIRPAMRASQRWRGLDQGLGSEWQQRDLALVALLLMRMEVPDSAGALARASVQQESETQPDPIADPLPLLLTEADRQRAVRRLGGGFSGMQQVQDQSVFAIDRLPEVTVHSLADWFRAQLTAQFPTLPPAQARAGLEAVLGAAMPAELHAEADLLVGRAALPEQLPADAPFALRIALWEPPDPDLADQVDLAHLSEVTPERLKELAPPIRAQVVAAQATAMSERDIGALIALAGDTGASRWLDSGLALPGQEHRTPRTVGENALRILAGLLAVDPRTLLGRDPAEPWSPAAQAATATALQAWWHAHADQPLATALEQTVPAIDDVGAASRLIAGRPAAEHAPLVAALVARWHAHPPLTASADMLTEALVALDGEPGVAEAVRSLPVVGAQRVVLAAWHACHGEQSHLDRLLAEVLAPDAPPPVASAPPPGAVPATDAMPAVSASANADVVLLLALRYPSEQRITRLVAAMAGPLTGSAAHHVLSLIFMQRQVEDPVDLLLAAKSCAAPLQGDPAPALVLQLAALGDSRPLPAGMFKADRDHALLQIGDTGLYVRVGKAGMPVVLPADLRLCDVMAVYGTRNQWLWGRPGQVAPFNLAQPLTAREEALVELRQLARETTVHALTRAKLPRTLLPAVGLPAAGTDGAVGF